MRCFLSLILWVPLAACLPTGSEAEEPTSPPREAPPSSGDPPALTGTLHVTTRLSLTPELLFPTPVEVVVVSLRDFSTAPAHTLLTLADEAGVPALSELRAVLPAALESRLEGWIDAEIAKVKLNGVPIPQLAGQAAALAETALTEVALHSDLTFAAGQPASHHLRALDFSPAGLAHVVPVGALPEEVVSATAAFTRAQATITLGAHSFGVRYGAHAWAAVDAALAAQTGASLRDTLGQAINCPALARAVASKCVLGVCVGHATELAEVCERGLDEVVARARAEMEALRLEAIALEAGSATVAAEGLTSGVWTAKLNGGQGLRLVPATFAAVR